MARFETEGRDVRATCHTADNVVCLEFDANTVGSVRLMLQALSIWPGVGGAARRSQTLPSADEDTNVA
jgi:hypothetical protein